AGPFSVVPDGTCFTRLSTSLLLALRCGERESTTVVVARGAPLASLPMLRHEARLRSGQIRATLSRQQRPVSPHVAHEHVEPLLQRAADDLAALHILLLRERNAVG